MTYVLVALDVHLFRSSIIGDGITTTFDLLVFLLAFVGVPALIFGTPIAALVFLSARRRARLGPNSAEYSATVRPWLLGLLVLIVAGILAFLLFAVGFTT